MSDHEWLLFLLSSIVVFVPSVVKFRSLGLSPRFQFIVLNAHSNASLFLLLAIATAAGSARARNQTAPNSGPLAGTVTRPFLSLQVHLL
jgi:hypothetical protein